MKVFKHNPLIITFLAVGFGETVGQVLIIRELIVNFQGNELSIGIILANWMLMTAIGSWGLGRFADRLPAKLSFFLITLLAFCIFLPGSLLMSRAVNYFLGLGIGEIAGIFPIFYSSL